MADMIARYSTPLMKVGSERYYETVDALAKARDCSREEAEHIVRSFMTTEAAKKEWSSFSFSLPQGASLDTEYAMRFNVDGTVTAIADGK